MATARGSAGGGDGSSPSSGSVGVGLGSVGLASGVGVAVGVSSGDSSARTGAGRDGPRSATTVASPAARRGRGRVGSQDGSPGQVIRAGSGVAAAYRLEWCPVPEPTPADEPLSMVEVQARADRELDAGRRGPPAARRAVREGRRGAGAGRRPGAGRDARPAPERHRPDHVGPPGDHGAAAQGVGGRDLGHGPRLRHDRLPQGRAGRSRSRRTAPSSYDPDSRKPDVVYGDTLEGDLGRRDFTVNAMAVALPGRTLRRPVRRARRPRPPRAADPGPPRGLVLRRPAPDDAGGPVRRPARVRGRPGRRGAR